MRIGPSYTGRILVEDLGEYGDVPPGETYQATTCRTRERLHLSDVLVRDFVLVELYVGNHFVHFVPTKEHTSVPGSRAYHLGHAGVDVLLSMDVVIHLKNDTDHPLRVRWARFEEER
jgi:hypothetical protein